MEVLRQSSFAEKDVVIGAVLDLRKVRLIDRSRTLVFS